MKTLQSRAILSWLLAGILSLAAALSASARMTVSLDDVVAVWTFNEHSGETVKDGSGNGNHGDFVNNVKRVAGKFGGALQLDGDTAYVQINNPVVTEAEDFTVGCWANPGETQKNYGNILSSHQEPPRQGMSIEQDFVNTNLYYLIAGDGNDWLGHVKGVAETQLTPGEWQHFVAVREGESLTHYVNGEVTVQSVVGDNSILPAVSNFRIGNWVLGGREWKGLVDDAFIFYRALAQDEIESLMSDGFVGLLPVSPRGKMAVAWGDLRKTN